MGFRRDMPFAASLITGLGVIVAVGGTDSSAAAMESREDVLPLATSAMEDAAENADAGIVREAAMRKAKVFMVDGMGVELCRWM